MLDPPELLKSLARSQEDGDGLGRVGGEEQLAVEEANSRDAISAAEPPADPPRLCQAGARVVESACLKVELGDLEVCDCQAVHIPQRLIDPQLFFMKLHRCRQVSGLRSQIGDISQRHGPRPHIPQRLVHPQLFLMKLQRSRHVARLRPQSSHVSQDHCMLTLMTIGREALHSLREKSLSLSEATCGHQQISLQHCDTGGLKMSFRTHSILEKFGCMLQRLPGIFELSECRETIMYPRPQPCLPNMLRLGVADRIAFQPFSRRLNASRIRVAVPQTERPTVVHLQRPGPVPCGITMPGGDPEIGERPGPFDQMLGHPLVPGPGRLLPFPILQGIAPRIGEEAVDEVSAGEGGRSGGAGEEAVVAEPAEAGDGIGDAFRGEEGFDLFRRERLEEEAQAVEGGTEGLRNVGEDVGDEEAPAAVLLFRGELSVDGLDRVLQAPEERARAVRLAAQVAAQQLQSLGMASETEEDGLPGALVQASEPGFVAEPELAAARAGELGQIQVARVQRTGRELQGEPSGEEQWNDGPPRRVRSKSAEARSGCRRRPSAS